MGLLDLEGAWPFFGLALALTLNMVSSGTIVAWFGAWVVWYKMEGL